MLSNFRIISSMKEPSAQESTNNIGLRKAVFPKKHAVPLDEARSQSPLYFPAGFKRGLYDPGAFIAWSLTKSGLTVS